MKTMNMPGFTAGDSLCKMSGHYRSGRHAITLPTPIISEVYPAREVIEVHSCPPGWTDYGGTCFPDPLTEPSGGGGGGPGPGPGGGGEGGVPGPGGGGTPTPHQKPPRVPPLTPPNPKEGEKCNALVGTKYGIVDGRYRDSTPSGGPKTWSCCDGKQNLCIGCGQEGKFTRRGRYYICRDGSLL